MEAYKIWATLNLKGDATTKINKLSKDIKTASNYISNLNRQLINMGKAVQHADPYFKSLATHFGYLLSELKPVNEQFAGLNRRLNNASPRADTLSNKVNQLSKNLNETAINASRAAREVFNLGMTNKVVGLNQINKQINKRPYSTNVVYNKENKGKKGIGFHGLHAAAYGLGAIVPEAGAVTGAYYAAGGAGVGLAAGGILAAQGFGVNKTLGQQRALLIGQGFSNKQINEFNQLVGNSPRGISPTRMGEALITGQLSLRDWSAAKKIAPDIAKISFAAQNAFGGMTDNQMLDMTRFAEMMNTSGNPEDMRKWLNVAGQMMLASGGSIMPSEMATFMRRSGGVVSGHMRPEDFLALEPLIQELRGSNAGTALTTGVRAMMNPQMSNFAQYNVKKLEKLGIWDKKTNRMKQSYLDLMMQAPDLFLNQVIIPALAKQGITSSKNITQEITADFPRTYGRALNVMYNNREIIKRSRDIARNILGSNDFFDVVSGTEAGAQATLAASWEKLAAAFGKLTDPAVIKVMNALSTFIEDFANVLNKLSKGEYGNIFTMKGSTINSNTSLSDVISFKSWKPKIFGQFKDVAKNVVNSTNGQSIGHIYLNADRVGQFLFNPMGNLLSSSGTESNPASFNNGLSPPPVMHNYQNGIIS